MAKKKPRIPPKLQKWVEAKGRYHLSDVQVQMARDLGMNPKNFPKYAAGRRGQPWKLPLGKFIEELYRKVRRREVPKHVYPLSGEPKQAPPRPKPPASPKEASEGEPPPTPPLASED